MDWDLEDSTVNSSCKIVTLFDWWILKVPPEWMNAVVYRIGSYLTVASILALRIKPVMLWAYNLTGIFTVHSIPVLIPYHFSFYLLPLFRMDPSHRLSYLWSCRILEWCGAGTGNRENEIASKVVISSAIHTTWPLGSYLVEDWSSFHPYGLQPL